MKPSRDVLVIKLGALGDVVRTTALLPALSPARVTWVCGAEAVPLLRGLPGVHRVVALRDWRRALDRRYCWAINLDESPAACDVVARADAVRSSGLRRERGGVRYAAAAAPLFDRSLVSRFGRRRADELKRRGRSSYQSLMFRACGLKFRGEPPIVPLSAKRVSDRIVAFETRVGQRWPLKAWSGWEELRRRLEANGLEVRVLRQRTGLADYLRDINECGVIVCGDTLALHVALALGKKAVGIFLCTSPAEIHGYGLLSKVVHPRLNAHFYETGSVPGFSEEISPGAVAAAVMRTIA